ncbi:hypothetical protein ACH41H_48225 [Streptomyces sp. NPDC020800]|uniref:hypothetical protein n=1 Tax=Streptomyces sp. NPDC020800 TaxID=3365092 RepID=UPI00378C70C0
MLTEFKKKAHLADQLYNASALETGGIRHIRFVTDPDCTANILNVQVPSSNNLSTSDNLITALKAQGYDSTNRVYASFVEYASSNPYWGTVDKDDSPGPGNANNTGPAYSWLHSADAAGSSCWYSHIVAHELGHNLGAVQASAPHATGALALHGRIRPHVLLGRPRRHHDLSVPGKPPEPPGLQPRRLLQHLAQPPAATWPPTGMSRTVSS